MSEKQQEPKVEATVNEVATETATVTAAETQPTKEGKLHTQEELEKILSNRLAREREKQAKELEEKTATLTQESQALKEQQAALQAELAKRDELLLAHKVGISADRADEALLVAKLRAEKNETTLEQALSEVASDYQLVRGKQGGVPITNQPKPSNPYVSEALAKRFPHLVKDKK